jgi:hypothetical protein
VLATSRPGTLLHAPISLGSQGALAFWPLAAAAVAGGIELVGALRARHQAGFDAVPMPGADAIDQRPALGEAGPRPDQANPELPGQPGGPPDERGSAFDLRPGRPAEDPRGHASGPDARGGDPGRAAL